MSWSSILKSLAQAVAAAQTPAPAPTPAPVKKPRATIAFVVLDEQAKPIVDAIATFDDGVEKQANEDGYMAVEREVGPQNVTFEAPDFHTTQRKYLLESNMQRNVTMTSTKPAPAPIPVPVPPPVVAPPPVVVPPAAPAMPKTDEEFKAAFLAILKKHNAPRTCNLQTLNDTKADIEAIGCEWQHTSGGELRPRLFLPVEFGADPYSRAYDVGLYGESWSWIKRY